MMTNPTKHQITILLVGAGSMGGALLQGWMANKVITAQSIIIDPKISDELRVQCDAYGLSVYEEFNACKEYPEGLDVIIFAVKPQLAGTVLPDFSSIAHRCVSISVMAGTSVASLSHYLGGAERIIRTMPNLPASIGEGISGLYASDAVIEHEKNLATQLLAVAGETLWVPQEEGIDFVTAVSGSGPAYFFLATEALAQAGEALGLDARSAAALARQTAIGAGALMAQDDRDAETLRKAVTSPGGTTAAALAVLDAEGAGLRPLFTQTVKAAAVRASELAD